MTTKGYELLLMQLLQGYVLKIDIESHRENNFQENSYFLGNKKNEYSSKICVVIF